MRVTKPPDPSHASRCTIVPAASVTTSLPCSAPARRNEIRTVAARLRTGCGAIERQWTLGATVSRTRAASAVNATADASTSVARIVYTPSGALRFASSRPFQVAVVSSGATGTAARSVFTSAPAVSRTSRVRTAPATSVVTMAVAVSATSSPLGLNAGRSRASATCCGSSSAVAGGAAASVATTASAVASAWGTERLIDVRLARRSRRT
ncbi:MAG TPA: hypothetical protein VFK59_04600 [Actinomycetota bacterium]|nr:hypothetical protein [Actinomycetota bacterium]